MSIFKSRSTLLGLIVVAAGACAALAAGVPESAAYQDGYYARDHTPSPDLPNPNLPASFEDVSLRTGWARDTVDPDHDGIYNADTAISDPRLTHVPHARAPNTNAARSREASNIDAIDSALRASNGPPTMSAQHPGYLSAPNYNIGGCNGAIAVAPDVRLRYVAGQSPLFISVVGGTFAGGLGRDLPVHTTLVIRGPDGHWYCDEAALEVNGNFINPAIVFHNPVSGNYEIWIGIKFPGPDTPDLPDVDLYISEAYAVTG